MSSPKFDMIEGSEVKRRLLVPDERKALYRTSSALKALNIDATQVIFSNDRGKYPLHLGLEANMTIEQLQELIYLGAKIDQFDEDGQTALHQAVLENKTEVVRFFVDNSADVSFKDSSEKTPLHLAVDASHINLDLVEILLQSKNCHIDQQDAKGYSALHYAALNNEALCKLLLKYGASVKVQDLKGKTPIDIWPELEKIHIDLILNGKDSILWGNKSDEQLDAILKYLAQMANANDNKRLFFEIFFEVKTGRERLLIVLGEKHKVAMKFFRIIQAFLNEYYIPLLTRNGVIPILLTIIGIPNPEFLIEVYDTLHTVIDIDPSKEFQRKLANSPVDVHFYALCLKNTPLIERTASLLKMLSYFPLAQSQMRAVKHLNLLIEHCHLPDISQKTLADLLAILANLSENVEHHIIFMKIKCRDIFEKYLSMPAPINDFSRRILVNLGIRTSNKTVYLYPRKSARFEEFAPIKDGSSVADIKSVPKAGDLVGLINFLITSDFSDAEFIDSFLMTYRTFTTPLIVYRHLMHGYEVASLKSKVIEVLERWLSDYYWDIKDNTYLQSANDEAIVGISVVNGGIIGALRSYVASNQTDLILEKISKLLQGIPLVKPQNPPFTFCNHNIIYSKAREMILSESLPCTEAEAVTLAAFQFQAENQIPAEDYANSPFSTSVFDSNMIKSLLPKKFHESKDLKSRLFAAVSPLRGQLEKTMKHEYVKTVSSLRTYGHQYFEVKFSDDRKKKMVDRLLGVGRLGVMVLDDKTNEIVYDWNLGDIKSWSLSFEDEANLLLVRVSSLKDAQDVTEYAFDTQEYDHISTLLTKHATQAAIDPDVPDIYDLKLNTNTLCPSDPLLGSLADLLPNKKKYSDLTAMELFSIPEELSRQLALLQYSRLKKMSPSDFIAYAVRKTTSSTGSEMEKELKSQNELLTSWIISEIVQAPDKAQRIQLFKNVVQFARMCHKNKNFNGLSAVIAALSSPSIRALNYLRESSPGDAKTIEKYEDLLCSKSNFALYRDCLASVTSPAIPIFDGFLDDLNTIADHQYEFTHDGKINYEKRYALFLTICEFQMYLRQDYEFVEIELIKEYLENLQPVQEWIQRELSNQLLKEDRKKPSFLDNLKSFFDTR